MIEVIVSTGDSAEAEDPEAAILAAQTLLREGRGTYYSKPTASFYVAGRLVREGVSFSDLSLLALANAKAV